MINQRKLTQIFPNKDALEIAKYIISNTSEEDIPAKYATIISDIKKVSIIKE